MSFIYPTISVIIPTLWRPTSFLQLLSQLDDCDDVMEIIIIDNASSVRPAIPKFNKVRFVDYKTNMFVNPSWNVGVVQAKSELVCICNDDVLPAANLIHFIRSTKIKGIIGLHPDSYKLSPEENPTPRLSKEVHVTKNWGSILFFEKKRYIPIPERMKIWWGDAWLAQEMRPAKSIKTAVFTLHSESAASPEFKEITRKDTELWQSNFLKKPSIVRRTANLAGRILRKLR